MNDYLFEIAAFILIALCWVGYFLLVRDAKENSR